MSTKEIKKFLKYVFSAKGAAEATKEKIEDFHFNFFLGICINGVIILVGSIFNIIGIKELNIWLGLIINFIVIFITTRPKIIAAVGTTGALLPDNKPAVKGLIDTEKLYAKFVVHILLFCSSFMLFLGIVSIRNNPNIVAVILFCGLLLVWVDIVWGVKTRTFEKATYVLIVVAVITNFLALPSRASYIRWLGFYPLEWISTSETDEKISDIEKAIFEQEQENDQLILDLILEKIKSGKPLTKYENIIYQNLKEKRKIGIIPNAISEASNGTENALEKAASALEKAALAIGKFVDNEEEGKNKGAGNDKTMTLQYLRTLHPFNGKGMGTTMYTAEFGTDYKKGDLLIVNCSKESLVWLDGEGGGWLHPDPDGRKKITTLTHGPGHILMEVPKGKNATIEVWRYLPL